MMYNMLYIGVLIAVFVSASSAFETPRYFTSSKYNEAKVSEREQLFQKIFRIKTPIQCGVVCTNIGSCNVFRFDKASNVCYVSYIAASGVEHMFPSDENGTLLWTIKRKTLNYKSAKRIATIETKLSNETQSSLTKLAVLNLNGDTVIFGADDINKKAKIFYGCEKPNGYCSEQLSLRETIQSVGRITTLSHFEVLVSDMGQFNWTVVMMDTNKSLKISRWLIVKRDYKDLERFDEFRFIVYREKENTELRIDIINSTDAEVMKTITIMNTKLSRSNIGMVLCLPFQGGLLISLDEDVLLYSHNGVKLWKCKMALQGLKYAITNYDENAIALLRGTSKVIVIRDKCRSTETILNERNGVSNPRNAASDSDGFIYITEDKSTMIQVFNFE